MLSAFFFRDDDHFEDITYYDEELYFGYDGNYYCRRKIDTSMNSTPTASNNSMNNILTQPHGITNNIFHSQIVIHANTRLLKFYK